MIRLHDYILSDDCYKVRLLLSMLRVDWEPVKVNIHPGAEHRRPDFLAVNPLGKIPVLTDGDLVLRTAPAILAYLARTHDRSGQWYPEDAAVSATILLWLVFSEAELRPLSDARALDLFGSDDDPAVYRAASLSALQVLEDHLAESEITGQDWVAASHPTIADLALFPSVAMAPDAGISLDIYPAIWRWIARVKRLPGFVVMPGVLPLLAG
jgi:glutathione S-transferase